LKEITSRGYNCAYVAIDHPRAFDEILYILMCGTGIGFSVERQFISHLPTINEDFYHVETLIQVHDSRIGWATAFRQLIALLYAGQIPKMDVSKVRAKGERLKTFGGRASGPEPLVQLFQFCIDIFKKAAGRKLNSVECHDIVCKIADIVIVRGSPPQRPHLPVKLI
jgi:ribonucleoside-triphosphate reductase